MSTKQTVHDIVLSMSTKQTVQDMVGRTVWLVGGVADVYADRADAWRTVAKIVREETEYKLKHQDKEIVLHLLGAGKVELALHHFNACVERQLLVHEAEIL